MGEFRMPALGADMVAGTLTEWYKHPGESVRRGDIIAAVDTDKGSIDIEVFEDGVVERVVVAEGQKVPVGTLLAVIRRVGETAPSPPVTPQPTVIPAAPPSPAAPVAPAAPSAPTQRPRVSPLARRLAAELGVDLAGITGSGAGGAIVQEDVEAAAPSGGDRQGRMRRAIAAAMARSKREIPHFYLATTIDFALASGWLAQWNAERKPAERLLPAVLLLKATALALLEFPELNARWENERVQPAEGIHIGVATSLRGGGLVVPALHHVNRKRLPPLMLELRDVVQRARTGNLRSSDLADGTITVTSLGERSADLVLGVIYPPQTAIVGFGSVVERPWVVGGVVAPRPVLMASLAADHRASDGHRGAAFLATIDRLLQSPEAL
ncbi:MAG TPA: dihydrolipoamide acetyltransferase family protein [Gemmatimonadales bacterium]|jgi:pyruvate dehydrogenase E2 component (dihydrolipoamide acetyltransferase)